MPVSSDGEAMVGAIQELASWQDRRFAMNYKLLAEAAVSGRRPEDAWKRAVNSVLSLAHSYTNGVEPTTIEGIGLHSLNPRGDGFEVLCNIGHTDGLLPEQPTSPAYAAMRELALDVLARFFNEKAPSLGLQNVINAMIPSP